MLAMGFWALCLSVCYLFAPHSMLLPVQYGQYPRSVTKPIVKDMCHSRSFLSKAQLSDSTSFKLEASTLLEHIPGLIIRANMRKLDKTSPEPSGSTPLNPLTGARCARSGRRVALLVGIEGDALGERHLAGAQPPAAPRAPPPRHFSDGLVQKASSWPWFVEYMNTGMGIGVTTHHRAGSLPGKSPKRF